MQCQIRFPSNWIDASRLEAAIRVGGDPHASGVYEVIIRFPVGCKMMIDAAIRLLALANQLAFTTRRVRLDFAEGESGTMGYLNRIGFFDHLAAPVEVTPPRPHYSGATISRHRPGQSPRRHEANECARAAPASRLGSAGILAALSRTEFRPQAAKRLGREQTPSVRQGRRLVG